METHHLLTKKIRNEKEGTSSPLFFQLDSVIKKKKKSAEAPLIRVFTTPQDQTHLRAYPP